MDIFIKTYAVIATIPFISFLLIYYLIIFLGKSKKIALDWSSYITSILLYSAVTAQLKVLFQLESSFWWCASWIALILVSLAFLQWKIRGKINYKKLMISTSKLGFITLGIFYITFFIVGLVIS